MATYQKNLYRTLREWLTSVQCIWTTHLSTILNSFRMSPAPLFKRRVNDSLIWFVLWSKESKLTCKCLGGHSFQRSERFSDGFMFCGGCSTVFDSSKRDRFPSRGGDRMARVHYLNSMACNGWECSVDSFLSLQSQPASSCRLEGGLYGKKILPPIFYY